MAGPERPGAHRVLVIEDEPDLLALLEHNLDRAGYVVRTAAAGHDGLRELEAFAPDLIVLDLMLPDISGFEVCRRINQVPAASRPAVVILSARTEEIDRVVGLEIGADDYLTKPFSLRELLLRIEARLRARAALRAVAGGDARPPAEAPGPERVVVGPLTVDLARHEALVEGRDVALSAIEMRLLACLVREPGRVHTRQKLLRDVWEYRAGVSSRTVDTFVKRLREKLGPAAEMIETVRGVGYRLSRRP
jgi:two-component system phosphate regulon response regulator PhoB